MTFRSSEFIDFNSGVVFVQPMSLQRELGPRSKQSPEQMLRMFECRVDVWQFGPATAMLREMEKVGLTEDSVWRHTGYGLVAVTFSYFEMIGKILNPNSKKSGSAGKDFQHGFRDVYPSFAASDDVGQFWDRVRNGIYHLGYTKSHQLIHHQPDVFPEDFTMKRNPKDGVKFYYVNPHRMTRTIVAHFPRLMKRLRDPAPEFDGLRKKFKQFYIDFHVGG